MSNNSKKDSGLIVSPSPSTTAPTPPVAQPLHHEAMQYAEDRDDNALEGIVATE